MTFSRRYLNRVVLALAFCCAVGLPVGAQTATPTPLPTPMPARTIRVTLLQVNDVYQIAPVDRGKRGGLARVAAMRRKILQESPHTLFLLGGDTIAPSVASSIFKGRQMIATWNAAALDYAVLGNHEFDFGPEVLRERMKESRFVWLGANVFDRKTGKSFAGMPPFIVREFEGVKVGIFGLLTTDTARASKAGEDVEFRNACETAKAIVPQIRARGAHVVVALTHLTLSDDKALARCAPIDVIIGGHEHTVLQSLSGRTPIFKMGSDARNLGRIDLQISATTGALESVDWEIIPVTDEVVEAPDVVAVVNQFEKQLSAELDKPVGTTSVELDARQNTNRTRETNLGSFIADAYRKWAGADVSIMNGGSVRSNTTYAPGTLTKRDVLSILPFENHIVKAEVTGAQIRAALEHGVARIVEDREEGRFPQVSGMEFTFDGRRPAGGRVVRVTVAGQPLDDKKTYTLATSAYLLGGGDGYTMFRDARPLIEPEEGPVEATVLMDAITAAKEIAPRTDGRIKRVDE
ncbi:MAG TPA: bifunctional UDP-sugar hydrolase/5'-nucleotidase [Pyrinomonadaceae bacterium]|jgi:5'-nucleotidase